MEKQTYNPCDECAYGIDRRDGSGNDSICKICEFRAQRQIIDSYAQSARVIALYLKDYCDEKLSYSEMIAEAARKADSKIQAQQHEIESQRQDIESFKRELDAEISVNESLVSDKDQQTGTIMRYEAMLKEAQQHLTKY